MLCFPWNLYKHHGGVNNGGGDQLMADGARGRKRWTSKQKLRFLLIEKHGIDWHKVRLQCNMGHGPCATPIANYLWFILMHKILWDITWEKINTCSRNLIPGNRRDKMKLYLYLIFYLILSLSLKLYFILSLKPFYKFELRHFTAGGSCSGWTVLWSWQPRCVSLLQPPLYVISQILLIYCTLIQYTCILLRFVFLPRQAPSDSENSRK